MEILTYEKVLQLVGSEDSGSNECITKSLAISIANANRKSITANLSLYLDNEYIDVFSVEDKPDLSELVFSTKSFGPTAQATTLSTTATSLDIDGHVVGYTATSDVDWITNIKINDNVLTFDVLGNTGAQRVGHIIGTNPASKSAKITITQEAYDAPLKYIYKFIAKNASGVPAITINGESITPALSGSDYVYEYILRVANESDAPSSVPFTITGGGTTLWTNEYSIAVTQTSWDLKDGLTKSFSILYAETLHEKYWDKASGFIQKEGSTTVTLSERSSRQSPTISYNVSDNTPSGSSFTYSKSGMTLTAKASDTNCAPSTISISYNGVSCTVGVTYTPEVWPDWTSDMYYFYWSDGSTTSTSISCNYAWDQTSSASYNAWSIVSGRKRTSSYGNVQEETVGYNGSKGIPSGSNTSTTSRSDSGTITQSGSNKTISWSWTQAGKPDEWSAWSYEFYWNIDGSKYTTFNETLSYNGRASKVSASNVVSTRSRVNITEGIGQIEDVAYSGTINVPTSDNTTSETKSFNTKLVLNGSGKSIEAVVAQLGTSTIKVLISGSAEPAEANNAIVKFGLTQAVPFDINVTGTCANDYGHGASSVTAPFGFTIPAGSTIMSCTVYFTSSETISNPIIADFTHSPKTKTVNNVTYHVEARFNE